jgi:hypothetical protein
VPDPRETFAGPEGAKVFVDPRSLRLLDGTLLDYGTSLLTKEKLASLGITLCSFSEAVQQHPDLVRQYAPSPRWMASLMHAVATGLFRP